MPDNQSPDWTDDAAFWDEAWTDMEQRLDAKPKRRRGVAWWARTLVLGTLLISGVLAAWALRSTDDSSLPPAAPSTSVVASAPVAEQSTPSASANLSSSTLPNNSEKNTQAPLATKESQLDAAPSPSTNSALPVIAPTTKEESKQVAIPGPSSPIVKTPTLATPETLPASGSTITSPSSPIAQATTVAPSARVQTETNLIATNKTAALNKQEEHKEDKQAFTLGNPSRKLSPSPFITAEPLLPLPVPSADLPTAKLARIRNPAQLRLDLGGTTSLRKLGYYAGLTYQLPYRGRWRFPISLRYRRDDLEITSIGPSDEIEAVSDQVSTPVLDPQAENIQAANAVLLDLRRSNFNELRTAGLELKVQAAYAITPRLEVMAGAGLQYLTAARGPVIISDTGGFFSISAFNAFGNLNIGNSQEYSFARGGSANQGAPNRVSRFVPRAYLGLRYALTSRLHLEAAASDILQPIYQKEVAGLQTGQLQLGLSWRLQGRR